MISIVPLVNMKYKDKISLHFNGKKQVVPMRTLLLTIEVYSKKIKYKIKKKFLQDKTTKKKITSNSTHADFPEVKKSNYFNNLN